MMEFRECLVVVPMKDPKAAKTRLSDALSPAARAALAEQLYGRTLGVLQRAQTRLPRFDLAVLTGSAAVRRIARGHGVAVIEERGTAGLSAAVDQAGAWAAARGYAAMAVLPGDLAAPRARDICTFIELGLNGSAPVICPAEDLGTNGIFVSPPDAISFAYGPRSALRHREALEAAGHAPVMLPLVSLRFDIDTSAGLAEAVRVAPDLDWPGEARA